MPNELEVVPSSTGPAFGQADLTNCEREQIHLAGSIQPHGALLLVREPDLTIVQVSANLATFLALDFDPLGRDLGDLGGDLRSRIQAHLDDPLARLPKAVRCHAGPQAAPFDALLHRPPEGGLIIELERPGPPVDLARHAERAIQAVLDAPSLRHLADEATRLFRDLAGYDRVMVYRFDDEGHGEVFAELREHHLEPYLGNRYPASDIPQIARRLYERNRVRVLVDRAYEPVPLVPRCSPFSGEDLDMSLCFLRSMSPIHLRYLENMGVAATLVVSLMVGGRLWGLIACHHSQPRTVHFEVRAVCELLAEVIGTRIAALESFQQGRGQLYVRRLEQRLIGAISREGDWRIALFDAADSLLAPLDAAGVALLFENEVRTAGEVPGTRELRDIGAWLDLHPRQPVIATASFGIDEPDFASLAPVASGVMGVPISAAPGEYLIWFRPERIRTITWGGNPFKPIEVGNDPATLSPRRSFSAWHQQVERTSDPWTRADRSTARLIGETVADVVLQFRSLRVLIAQDQLEQIRNQVRASDQPVVVADPAGRILLINEAFERLTRAAHSPMRHLTDLQELLGPAGLVHEHLRQLVANRKSWRGEITLNVPGEFGPERPFLVRADPVFSAPSRVLGFVFLFTDLAERRVADAARARFQDGIVTGPRTLEGKLDTRSDVLFQNLLSAVVENAQLAAMEITDGVETNLMPELLDSVRDSVNRTASVLEHLIWHATETKDEPPGGA